MIKTKHQLGVMDLYPISANKTPIHFETVDVRSFEQANLRLTI